MRQQNLKLGSRKRERGLTVINFFLLAVLIGGYFWVGIKLFTPVKTNWEIGSILKELPDDPDIYRLSKEGIKKLLMRRINLNSLYHINAADVVVEKTSRDIIVKVEKIFLLPLSTNAELKYQVNRLLTVDIEGKTSELE